MSIIQAPSTKRSIHLRQVGATLVETMISLALSMIVVASMVGLMGNSMGSATRIIEMSQLTDELRNAMSMMSRDVRRANFNPNSTYCYANSDCTADVAPQANDILVTTCNGKTHLVFGLDRNWDGDASNDGGGAFRRNMVVNQSTNETVGVIEIWTGSETPGCANDNDPDWMQITDPEYVDVTVFDIQRPFFEDTIAGANGTTVTKRSRQVVMTIEGELVLDRDIRRRIADRVKVRNDMLL